MTPVGFGSLSVNATMLAKSFHCSALPYASTATAGTVGHGSTVKVRDLEDNSETEYHIVGSQDANPMLGRISSDSPFGMALFGHKKGETVTFEAPAGAQSFVILAIDN